MTPGLSLISIGIHDEKDLSLRALEEARTCDVLYAEMYTTKLDTDLERLGDIIGKPVQEIPRSKLEEDSNTLLDKALKTRVGVLVGGDCLSATTHVCTTMCPLTVFASAIHSIHEKETIDIRLLRNRATIQYHHQAREST